MKFTDCIDVIKVVEASCPMVCHGGLKDGRVFITSYRYGVLTVRVSVKPTPVTDDARTAGFVAAVKTVGEAFSGYMTVQDLKEILGQVDILPYEKSKPVNY